MGGENVTIGQIVADSGKDVRIGEGGWKYVQLTGDRANGTHVTVRPSGLADHTTTYQNGYRVGRDKI